MEINLLKCLLVGLGLQAQVVLQLDSLDAVSHTQRYQNEELRYYERTHGMRDEGFGSVMTYWQRLILEMSRTDSLRAVLQEAVYRGDPGLPARRALLERLQARKSMVVQAAEQQQRALVQLCDNNLFWLARGMARKRHFVMDMSRQGALLRPYVGSVRDSMGVFTGELDGDLRPEGYGTRTGHDGSYSEGFWHEGVLHGWGFVVPKDGLVLCGRWQKGRFLGERMEHDVERVYGIDISRHQHDKGRKVFPINWQQMTISRFSHSLTLDAMHRSQAATDTVTRSVPVAFVYVKSSQGTAITNRYYAADVRAARRRGIPVGAYHFFSPTSGLAQAEFFLAQARPQVGDLPPMLDVELQEWQIAQMGGEEAMFSEIETWVYTVQKACGTRPLLYMGQNFVVKHLPNAPMTLQGYPMWVARYSEYRPFVRLAFWQLSQSGRVRGIKGDVDIDVFNGTREMFEEFCQENAVKKNGL